MAGLWGNHKSLSICACFPRGAQWRTSRGGGKEDFGVQLQRDCVSGTMPCGDRLWVTLCCHNNVLQDRGSFSSRHGQRESTTKKLSGVVFADALFLVCTLPSYLFSPLHIVCDSTSPSSKDVGPIILRPFNLIILFIDIEMHLQVAELRLQHLIWKAHRSG